MIFVTVKTDQPFDRMLRVIDSWARWNQQMDVFAQIGAGVWKPDFIVYVEFLELREIKRRFEKASLIMSSDGMGTIDRPDHSAVLARPDSRPLAGCLVQLNNICAKN
jgi:UDP-N-acetylglucosamine transferase subunit ALG13